MRPGSVPRYRKRLNLRAEARPSETDARSKTIRDRLTSALQLGALAAFGLATAAPVAGRTADEVEAPQAEPWPSVAGDPARSARPAGGEFVPPPGGELLALLEPEPAPPYPTGLTEAPDPDELAVDQDEEEPRVLPADASPRSWVLHKRRWFGERTRGRPLSDFRLSLPELGVEDWTYPIDSTLDVGSAFGRRRDPITGRGASHHGWDIGCPRGTPLFAAADGIVKTSTVSRTAGRFVEIVHGELDDKPVMTRYLHMRRLHVKRGQSVKKGQRIGICGNTGRSTSRHLHFGVYHGGRPISPLVMRPSAIEREKAEMASWDEKLRQAGEAGTLDALLEAPETPLEVAQLIRDARDGGPMPSLLEDYDAPRIRKPRVRRTGDGPIEPPTLEAIFPRSHDALEARLAGESAPTPADSKPAPAKPTASRASKQEPVAVFVAKHEREATKGDPGAEGEATSALGLETSVPAPPPSEVSPEAPANPASPGAPPVQGEQKNDQRPDSEPGPTSAGHL